MSWGRYHEIKQMLFLLLLSPSNFSIHKSLRLQRLLLWSVPFIAMMFSISLCPSTFIPLNFILRKSSLFSPNQLSNKLSQTRVIYLFKSYDPVLLLLGFPSGSDSKDSACNAGDLSLVPGMGRSPLCIRVFQLRPLGTPLIWLFCSINKPLSFLSIPLFSGNRCSWLLQPYHPWVTGSDYRVIILALNSYPI